jgi:uncharacterized protein (TIGR03437 family)
MKLTSTLLALAAAGSFPAAAQVWDTSGNGKLNGNYYFREVIYTSSDSIALYGGMTFAGDGTYTIDAASLECDESSCSGPNPYKTTGTYSISAGGYGFMSHPAFDQDSIYGLVGANGVFIGSSTEGGTNDLFIAAPIGSQSVSTLNGSYSLAYLTPYSNLTGSPVDAMLQLNANGAGTIGTVKLSAYVTSPDPSTQSISGVKYSVSNNAFVVTFPDSQNNLLIGQEYLYTTPDGSFVFGGSPQDFDMFVGVRQDSAPANFGGLYYETGLNVDNSELDTGYSYLSSFYGAFNAASGVIVGHERIQPGERSAYDYTYSDSYPKDAGGTYQDETTSAQFVAGSGGAAQIGLGTGPYLGISVSFQAPTFSGPGVYLNPVGVVNAASYAPFTTGIARGEYITLTGTNLGPDILQVASTVPFPTNLAGVEVLINGIKAPIYYVSSTQISAIVPYLTTGSIAQIQVVNNGATSNVVTQFVNATAPGAFSQGANGIGYAAAEHDDGSLVTPSNPAQVGESVSVYATGFGDVQPGVADGSAAPADPLSNATNEITAAVGGVTAPVYYAGLAPGFVALYQLNLQIPDGVANGDNFLDISGPDSYSSEALIPVEGGTAATTKELRARPNVLRRPVRRGQRMSLRDRAHVKVR